MTDLQLIICAAIVAFAISAVFGIGVIFSVCEMLKQLDEETQDDQQQEARYEYTTRYVNTYNREGEHGNKLTMLLQEMGANGWRVLELQNTHNQFYYIYFERLKVEGKK